MQQLQQSGKPPMQRAEFEELVWRLWKEDGSPQLQLHSYMQGAIVMDRHYRSMAPASPVEELEKVKEELRLCIRERNKYLYQLDTLTESKPSPVIEIGEQKVVSKEEFKEWLNKRDYGGPSAGMYRKGGWDAYVFLTEYPASHPAPAPIVGERDKKTECTCICGPTDTNPICAWPNCFKPEENTGNSVVRTEQALPEEEKEKLGWEIVVLAERLAQSNGKLDALKEVAEITNAHNDSLFKTLQEQLASARTLITKIKRWDVYQEPADECDKWLNNNPEVKP
jgi:hypothetical protein